MFLNLCVKIYSAFTKPLKNEKGAQSLEWLGLAALLILVLGIVSTAVDGGKDTIKGIIEKILSKIKDMVG